MLKSIAAARTNTTTPFLNTTPLPQSQGSMPPLPPLPPGMPPPPPPSSGMPPLPPGSMPSFMNPMSGGGPPPPPGGMMQRQGMPPPPPPGYGRGYPPPQQQQQQHMAPPPPPQHMMHGRMGHNMGMPMGMQARGWMGGGLPLGVSQGCCCCASSEALVEILPLLVFAVVTKLLSSCTNTGRG